MKLHVRTSLDAGPWKREGGPRHLLRAIREAVRPLSNPDFESQYDNVFSWLLEVDDTTGIVSREIGLDETGRPIAIAPFRDNTGFWTDGDEPLDWQGMIRLSEAAFEKEWARFHATWRPTKRPPRAGSR